MKWNGYHRGKSTGLLEFESQTNYGISPSTDILEKGMKPIILPQVMGKTAIEWDL